MPLKLDKHWGSGGFQPTITPEEPNIINHILKYHMGRVFYTFHRMSIPYEDEVLFPGRNYYYDTMIGMRMSFADTIDDSLMDDDEAFAEDQLFDDEESEMDYDWQGPDITLSKEDLESLENSLKNNDHIAVDWYQENDIVQFLKKNRGVARTEEEREIDRILDLVFEQCEDIRNTYFCEFYLLDEYSVFCFSYQDYCEINNKMHCHLTSGKKEGRIESLFEGIIIN